MYKTQGITEHITETLILNDSAKPQAGELHGWVPVNRVENIPRAVRLRYSSIFFSGRVEPVANALEDLSRITLVGSII